MRSTQNLSIKTLLSAWPIPKTATLLETLRTSILIQNHTVPCRSLTLRTSKIQNHKKNFHIYNNIYIYIILVILEKKCGDGFPVRSTPNPLMPHYCSPDLFWKQQRCWKPLERPKYIIKYCALMYIYIYIHVYIYIYTCLSYL